jgi:hypothetical protein
MTVLPVAGGYGDDSLVVQWPTILRHNLSPTLPGVAHLWGKTLIYSDRITHLAIAVLCISVATSAAVILKLIM